MDPNYLLLLKSQIWLDSGTFENNYYGLQKVTFL